MPSVTLKAFVPGAGPAEVFTRLADFSAYPRYTATVREVTVTELSDGAVASHWTVDFRNGVLCWSERDRVDPDTLTIGFTQTEGDFERFEGTWRVAAAGADDDPCVRVDFTATFDLGMPSLASILDPVARQALSESIGLILRGLFGRHTTVTETVDATDAGPVGAPLPATGG
ncbi:type II toxin-antitoxin system RatA family toxin [Streptomyces sp. NPDC054796]